MMETTLQFEKVEGKWRLKAATPREAAPHGTPPKPEGG
jgi:hypothetical protein